MSAVETVNASPNVQDLTGVGREFLLSPCGTWIRAEFLNGNLVRILPKGGSTENTVLIEGK